MASRKRKETGSMSISEAARRGGRKVYESRGREWMSEIGHRGGQRVRELIERGRAGEGGGPGRMEP